MAGAVAEEVAGPTGTGTGVVPAEDNDELCTSDVLKVLSVGMVEDADAVLRGKDGTVVSSVLVAMLAMMGNVIEELSNRVVRIVVVAMLGGVL